jgi:hypothetical protein
MMTPQRLQIASTQDALAQLQPSPTYRNSFVTRTRDLGRDRRSLEAPHRQYIVNRAVSVNRTGRLATRSKREA